MKGVRAKCVCISVTKRTGDRIDALLLVRGTDIEFAINQPKGYPEYFKPSKEYYMDFSEVQKTK